jgi:uncharacterized membrane protein YcaP (DUF421 family)
MESVFRTVVMYLVLLVLFRLTGKRSLAETSTFDFVLLLVISEATQQALVGDDHSITAALLVITTLLTVDVGLSLLKQYSPAADRLIDSVPIVVLVDGEPLRERMLQERINEDDILHQARRTHGLERLDQIRYAILEPSGGISIIPKHDPRPWRS